MASNIASAPFVWFLDWQRINIRTALLATIVFLLVYLLVKQSRKKWNTPPGPRAWLPLVGHLAMLDSSSPYRTMAELTKTYGPIVSLQFGSFPAVVLNNYASVYQAFVKQGHDFDDRPNTMIAGDGKNISIIICEKLINRIVPLMFELLYLKYYIYLKLLTEFFILVGYAMFGATFKLKLFYYNFWNTEI